MQGLCRNFPEINTATEQRYRQSCPTHHMKGFFLFTSYLILTDIFGSQAAHIRPQRLATAGSPVSAGQGLWWTVMILQ